jgi:threonyl-tRNA synthetase
MFIFLQFNPAEVPGPGQGLPQPVMIHRAILGSFERMLGILIEHFGGKWPFWLSPRQVLIIPVNLSEKVKEYSSQVQKI